MILTFQNWTFLFVPIYLFYTVSVVDLLGAVSLLHNFIFAVKKQLQQSLPPLFTHYYYKQKIRRTLLRFRALQRKIGTVFTILFKSQILEMDTKMRKYSSFDIKRQHFYHSIMFYVLFISLWLISIAVHLILHFPFHNFA